jgi:hypothetical protein
VEKVSGFLCTPVSSTNKTDCHNITDILLKVALNTIKPSNFTIFNIKHDLYDLLSMTSKNCWLYIPTYSMYVPPPGKPITIYSMYVPPPGNQLLYTVCMSLPQVTNYYIQYVCPSPR